MTKNKKVLKNISLIKNKKIKSVSNILIENLTLSNIEIELSELSNLTLRNVKAENVTVKVEDVNLISNLFVSGLFKDVVIEYNGKKRILNGEYQTAINYFVWFEDVI
jgi:hypothetical protein